MSEKIKYWLLIGTTMTYFSLSKQREKYPSRGGGGISKRRNERIMYQSFTLWTLGHHREYKATQLADYISALGKIYVRSYQGCRIHIRKKKPTTHYAKVRPFHRLLSYFCTSLTMFYAVHAVSTLSDGQKQLSVKFSWCIVANNDTYTLHMHPKKGMLPCFGSPYLDNRGATSELEMYCFVRKKTRLCSLSSLVYVLVIHVAAPSFCLKKRVMPSSRIMNKIKPNKQR